MTRAEAQISLAKLKQYMSGGGVVDRKANEAIDMAIKALEEPQWIPTSERPPEESGNYLVTHHPDYIPVGCIQTDVLDFEDGTWYWWNEKAELEKWDKPIIAWKPMPEPYRMEGEADGSNKD